MKFRSPFDYDVEAASNEATIPADEQGVSMTVQAHGEDADINVMMKRFKITGQLPATARVPMAGDFTDVTDYRSALHAVMAAEDAFMSLPADARAKFDNDPQKLLELASSADGVEKLKSMGLGKEIALGLGATAPVIRGVDNGSGKVEGSVDRGGGAAPQGVPVGAGVAGSG